MISYLFNKSLNILDVSFEGMIDPKEILDFMHEINNNDVLPRELNVIIDVRNADYVFEPISIQNIVKANYRMNHSFVRIINAILANHPDDPTISLFYQHMHDSHNFKVEIFNNRDKALVWIKYLNQ